MGRVSRPRDSALLRERADFLRAILDGDRRLAYGVLKRCFDGRNAAELYECVVCPSLHTLGDMWARDEISVADEHLASATADAAMVALYPDFDWPLAKTSRVFIACPEGERHVLGARMLADLLALDGWDEMYFGADVPAETLATKAGELRPRVVALSVSIADHLAKAREAAESVRAASPETKIVLGGRAIADEARIREIERMSSYIVEGSAAEAVAAFRDWR